ncbi:MAG: acyl-CoA dehydrogenase family protein [Actinobacteria bacterium]|nr:acyl-CoA dehydrogenase family protein [Actinomycetota bacterium]
MTEPTTEPTTELTAPSFVKPLFLGELHESIVLPYPRMAPDEHARIDTLTTQLREWAAANYDERDVEQQRWIPDATVRALGEMGMLGLYVEQQYGGLGLSQTGYCRMFEVLSGIDATLGVVLGVHQSIGYKGIHLFGSDEQKQRFLPDLASGRRLAGFALTEPHAGSDAYHLETTCELQPDGSYVLNGEKRYIGNGSRADVLTTFARTPSGGHVALLLESDTDGFEVGDRYDTMGLRANDLRRLRFRDVRVPKENVLGSEGQGFAIAMQILNNGRMSLGSGSVAAARSLTDMAIAHVTQREQFGRPLAEFELVQDKIGWMVAYTYGLEAMSYLTTGLVDRGLQDYSLESAIVKVAGTDFIWQAANRAFQLAGGKAYLRSEPYEKILRDIRIFPIFEGANDVLRSYIALNGIEPVAAQLSGLSHLGLRDPITAVGVVADYVGAMVRRKVQPPKLRGTQERFASHAEVVSDQVEQLRAVTERLLRRHGEAITARQAHHKRLAAAVTDIYAQIATLARVSDVLERPEQGMIGDEPFIAETFCLRAADRVRRQFDQIEHNDDARTFDIARAAYGRARYHHSV